MNDQWRAHHPYPTNPFERVSGKELEKLHRQAQKKPTTPDLPPALL